MLASVEPASRPAVVGVADHRGWANLVTVAAGDDGSAPAVIDRRRPARATTCPASRTTRPAATAATRPSACSRTSSPPRVPAPAGPSTPYWPTSAAAASLRWPASTASGRCRTWPGASRRAAHARGRGQFHRDRADHRVALHPRRAGRAAALLGTTAGRLRAVSAGARLARRAEGAPRGGRGRAGSCRATPRWSSAADPTGGRGDGHRLA
jgi:hypothetical protein